MARWKRSRHAKAIFELTDIKKKPAGRILSTPRCFFHVGTMCRPSVLLCRRLLPSLHILYCTCLCFAAHTWPFPPFCPPPPPTVAYL